MSLSDHCLVYCVRKFSGAVAKGHKIIKTWKIKVVMERHSGQMLLAFVGSNFLVKLIILMLLSNICQTCFL